MNQKLIRRTISFIVFLAILSVFVNALDATTVVCNLLGDYPPCDEVTLAEVIDFINQWAVGNAELSGVIGLINAWAGSPPEMPVTVTRDLPDMASPGDIITVRLEMEVDENNTPVAVGITEYIPEGWIVKNISLDGIFFHDPDRIEWLFWSLGNPVKDQSIIYAIQVPPNVTSGIYTFSGIVDTGYNTSNITGDSSITIITKCWSGENQYLLKRRNQMKKFCRCAEGTYDYKRYRRVQRLKLAHKYVDPGDNENWETTPKLSYRPVYKVMCSDGSWYNTNQDYYYP